jgi:hypothetical protein
MERSTSRLRPRGRVRTLVAVAVLALGASLAFGVPTPGTASAGDLKDQSNKPMYTYVVTIGGVRFAVGDIKSSAPTAPADPRPGMLRPPVPLKNGTITLTYAVVVPPSNDPFLAWAKQSPPSKKDLIIDSVLTANGKTTVAERRLFEGSEVKTVKTQAMDAGGNQVAITSVTLAYERAVVQKLP